MAVPDLSDVTVVVLSWNSAETLATCLASAVDQRVGQVLVVDNGSRDGSAEIAERIAGVEVVRQPRNLGFAGGQVAALPHCRGQVLLLLNADAVLLEDAVARMLVPFDDATVAVVGCEAVAWDHEDGRRPVDRVVVHPFTAHTRPAHGTASGQDVNSVSAAAVAIRRSALESVGGFDPRFFAYYEETDLFARMKRSGWKVRVAPEAVVRHKVAASLGEGSPMYLRLMTRNRYRFALRNFDREFLLAFIGRYVAEETRALLVSRGTAVGRARARGACQALVRTPQLLWERRRLPYGATYNRLLLREEPTRVSVVIPCFNHEATVLEAVRSARTQTLPPVEVVVVDDGSTDGSLALLRAAESRGECRVVAQANAGVARARNAGAQHASGEWLVFLDADDALEPEYVEQCWTASLRSRGTVGVVTTGVLRSRVWGVERVRPPRHRLARLAAYNYVHCASMVRREAFDQVGGFSDDMAGGYEDWDLFLGIASRSWRVIRVPAPLLRYRVSPASRNAGAALRERELRELLRTRHPDVYGERAGRLLAAEVRARTFLARLSVIGRELLAGDVDALRRRMRQRRSRSHDASQQDSSR